jgi:hypothetical protein
MPLSRSQYECTGILGAGAERILAALVADVLGQVGGVSAPVAGHDGAHTGIRRREAQAARPNGGGREARREGPGLWREQARRIARNRRIWYGQARKDSVLGGIAWNESRPSLVCQSRRQSLWNFRRHSTLMSDLSEGICHATRRSAVSRHLQPLRN